MRVFAGSAFQGEEEHAARHLVGCDACSALAAEVVAELAARQALAPGKRSVRVLADLLRARDAAGAVLASSNKIADRR